MLGLIRAGLNAQSWRMYRQLAILSWVSLLLCGCSQVNAIRLPSENFDHRIKHIVIHYTSQNLQTSLKTLTKKSDNPVSSHYLISSEIRRRGNAQVARLYQLVNEHDRAWHAGISTWGNDRALNYTSIGIEIVNESGCEHPIQQLGNAAAFYSSCKFKPFSRPQISTLTGLIQNLQKRYPDIKPINILGHSDIAPDRKIDPGPNFPWKLLFDQGVGTWYDDGDLRYFLDKFSANRPTVLETQRQLSKIGYAIKLSGEQDRQSQMVVRAFQARYVPDKFSGILDSTTEAIIFSIAKKYR